MWAAALSAAGLPIPNTQLLRLLRWVLRRPQQVSLWEIRAWQEITSNWHDPHRQHDAGEFLYFLGEALTSGTGVGFWQARVETGSRDAQVVDHGEMFPLILQQVGPQPHSVASRDISLQALIVAWRNQEARHAALTLPAVLPVQICRFDNRGHKIPGKV